jgi:hypothetical protein
MLNHKECRLGRIINEDPKSTLTSVFHFAFEADAAPLHSIEQFVISLIVFRISAPWLAAAEAGA